MSYNSTCIIKIKTIKWDRLIYISRTTSSSLDHTLSVCPCWAQYHFKNVFWKNLSLGLLQWSSLQTKEGQRRSKVNLVRLHLKQLNAFDLESMTKWSLRVSSTTFPNLNQTLHSDQQRVGNIWRTLSKPFQRAHYPVPRPFWLLVDTSAALEVYRFGVT